MEVSLNYYSQNGGNVYRDPYYNGNPNIGPRIIGSLDQSPYTNCYRLSVGPGLTSVAFSCALYNFAWV